MPVYEKGNLVIARFPHEEDNTIFDKRPCLILLPNNDVDVFWAAKITTTQLDRVWAYKLDAGNSQFSRGYLKLDSWINLRRRELISASDIFWCVAELKQPVYEDILNRLKSLI